MLYAENLIPDPKSLDLPPKCLSDKPHFRGAGIDYTGVLFCINRLISDSIQEDELCKCYIVINTCAVSRDIVLDLVPDVSAQTFIHSFRRFISSRGGPLIILSVNGSPFIANSTQEFATNYYNGDLVSQ